MGENISLKEILERPIEKILDENKVAKIFDKVLKKFIKKISTYIILNPMIILKLILIIMHLN